MNRYRAHFHRGLLTVGVVVAGIGYETNAHATLGGDVASIAANVRHLSGELHVHKLVEGERHELRLPSGIVVSEYRLAGGAVYAIAWSGTRPPDLRELLGPYFGQLSVPEHRRPLGHHRMSVSGTDLEIRSSGRRGSFGGRAWVPSRLPPGVDPQVSLGTELAQ